MTADTSDAEHPALLAAIGRALGQDGPYAEHHGERAEAIHLGTMQRLPAGASLEVLGGAVEPETGRVAWLEQRTDVPEGGSVPVSIDLHVAWRGQYFGCRLQFMRWYGETLSFIYREKHRTIAVRMEPPYEEWELVALQDLGAVDGDTLLRGTRERAPGARCVPSPRFPRGAAAGGLGRPGVAVRGPVALSAKRSSPGSPNREARPR